MSMRTARGFTLLEILVVMSLLSVIMLALGSAMRTMARTQERVDTRLATADELRIATAFIRTTTERISARQITAVQSAGANRFYFEPGRQAVAWVGVMPARYGAGGRHFFRLGLEPDGASNALVIRFLPWADIGGFPNWQQAESRVLVRDVTGFAIDYEDELAPQPAWLAEWTVPDRLPGRLLLSVQTAAQVWPPTIVALRPMLASRTTDGFVLGGSD